jgi:hypothetical protein
VNDFDFLVGEWIVSSRRLVARLVGSDNWETFPGRSRVLRVFDGAANVDEIRFPTKGFSGLTLRIYEPSCEVWWLYWVNSRDGVLQPPVVGCFTDGRGEFYGDDVHDGTPIRVRYLWSDITPTSARWAQAFSADGEATWETNWVMEFTRTEPVNDRGVHGRHQQ